ADASGNVWMAGTFASIDLAFGSANVTNTSNDFDTYNAKIGAAAGCSLNVSASANPICKTKKTNLTASGATTYTWSPATGLNTTTGAVVVAKPTATTTYTVSGDGGACTATIK